MSERIANAEGAGRAGVDVPSSRAGLSRQRIVTSAIAFVEEEGLPSLTMRRLGLRLGVEAMALYRYVPSKEDLLDAVVADLVAQMHRDDEVLATPEHGWQDFLQRLAHGVRQVALGHPRCFPLVASRPPEAPWLRPPLRSLDWVETILVGLREEGFGDEAVVRAYRAFTSFLLGHLLLEVSALGADVGALDAVDEGAAGAGVDRYPTVRRLASRLSEDQAAAEFEESLENLLERLALMRTQDPSSH